MFIDNRYYFSNCISNMIISIRYFTNWLWISWCRKIYIINLIDLSPLKHKIYLYTLVINLIYNNQNKLSVCGIFVFYPEMKIFHFTYSLTMNVNSSDGIYLFFWRFSAKFSLVARAIRPETHFTINHCGFYENWTHPNSRNLPLGW